MSDAIIGTGILLKAGDGATPTEVFTTVAEIVTAVVARPLRGLRQAER